MVGEEYKLMVNRSWNIGRVKSLLYRLTGLRPEQQVCFTTVLLFMSYLYQRRNFSFVHNDLLLNPGFSSIYSCFRPPYD